MAGRGRDRGRGEFVRLTPGQFSLAIAFIVLLLAAAAAVGYRWGSSKAPATGPVPYPPLVLAPENSASADAAAGRPASAAALAGRSAPAEVHSIAQVPAGKPAALPPGSLGPADTGSAAPPAQGPHKVSAGEEKPLRAAGRIMVQVASCRTPVEAKKVLTNVASLGFPGIIVPVQLGDKGAWYRVQAGPFPDEQTAKKAIAEIASRKGLQGFIVR